MNRFRLLFTLGLLALTPVAGGVGREGLCVVGCTPYVDQTKPHHGMEKYHALAAEMASTCDVIVHVGDTKPGKTMGCNATTMTTAISVLVEEGAPILLYAPGDNEINDCHRLQSSADEKARYPSEFLKAADARQHLVDKLNLNSGRDITGSAAVHMHERMNHLDNPATCDEHGNNCQKYSCDFDKYIEFGNYAVATLEVIGSHWYLDDEIESGYMNQDEVDPLEGRLALYVNAKDCALDWIEYAASTARANEKRVVFFMLHASFYGAYGSRPLGSGTIGEYYSPDNLRNKTVQWGDPVRRPYLPLFNKFKDVAFEYPEMHFQIVHSDAHRWFQTRFNPFAHNTRETVSHHNMMIHQTEGASRALTTFTRFTVDPTKFQPIAVKEEWSQAAYDIEPVGHAWIPYKPS